MNIKTSKVLLTAATTVLLSACGGGGSDSGVTPPVTGGPSSTQKTSVGAISAFGSVYVNGVRFDTNNAAIIIGGESGVEDQLKVGQIVVVKGSVDDDGDNGRADSVEMDEDVQGPIESIDATTGQMLVLGQTVQVDELTVFDDSISPDSLDGLAVGDIVEVSGFRDVDGVITASRIEKKAPGAEFKVRGTVSDHDPAGLRFSIQALRVDYSSALLDDLTGGAPTDGEFVEVKGRDFGPAGELLATKVEGDDDRMPEDGEVEVEGLITRFASATDFDVAGQPVTTNASTRFEGGTADDLAEGVKVEVEGFINSDGMLVADKVQIKRAKNVRLEGPIDGIDAGGNTVSVFGIPVRVDELTQLEDDSDSDVRMFSLDDLAVGDFVEVRGGIDPDNSGGVLAARLERDDADDRVRLRGPIESASEPSLTILGVTIETTASTEFEGRGGNRLSATEFFAAVSPGDIVQAKGTLQDTTTIIARDVEFEDDDD